MDLVALLPAFVVAVVVISASPGPAMALIMRRAALRGFAGAVPTVLGLEAHPATKIEYGARTRPPLLVRYATHGMSSDPELG